MPPLVVTLCDLARYDQRLVVTCGHCGHTGEADVATLLRVHHRSTGIDDRLGFIRQTLKCTRCAAHNATWRVEPRPFHEDP